MENYENENHYRLCIHEASHVVFIYLLNKIDSDFPPLGHALVQIREGHTEYSAETATAPLRTYLFDFQDELENVTDEIGTAEMIFAMAGSSTYKTVINEDGDSLYDIDKYQIGNPFPRDFEYFSKIGCGYYGISLESVKELMIGIDNAINVLLSTYPTLQESINNIAKAISKEKMIRGEHIKEEIEKIQEMDIEMNKFFSLIKK